MSFIEAKIITDSNNYPLDKQHYELRVAQKLPYRFSHAFLCTKCYGYAWMTEQQADSRTTIGCFSCGYVASNDNIISLSASDRPLFVWDRKAQDGNGKFVEVEGMV